MNLFLRVVSAVILLPIVLWALIFSQITTLIAILLAIAIASDEYVMMVCKPSYKIRVLWIAGASLACLTVAYTQSAITVMLIVASLYFLWAGIATLRPSITKEMYENTSTALWGVGYVGFGLLSIFLLRGKFTIENQGLDFVFLAMVVTWSNDTCAYFAGRAFGKHKLLPQVSPNKTWEGFVGGAVGSVTVPFLVCFLMAKVQVAVFSNLTTQDILFIGVSGIVLVPLGDLIESRLKRLYNVKDSGKILPGHGGLLDRVDALLLMAPWTLLYVHCVRDLWL